MNIGKGPLQGLTKMVMSIFTVSRSKGVQSPLMSAFSVDPRSLVKPPVQLWHHDEDLRSSWALICPLPSVSTAVNQFHSLSKTSANAPHLVARSRYVTSGTTH